MSGPPGAHVQSPVERAGRAAPASVPLPPSPLSAREPCARTGPATIRPSAPVSAGLLLSNLTITGGEKKKKKTLNLDLKSLNGGKSLLLIQNTLITHKISFYFHIIPLSHPCVVDGAWDEWTPWSLCSSTCGRGYRDRTRICKQPQNGGEPCRGPTRQTKFCNIAVCPGESRNPAYFRLTDWCYTA